MIAWFMVLSSNQTAIFWMEESILTLPQNSPTNEEQWSPCWSVCSTLNGLSIKNLSFLVREWMQCYIVMSWDDWGPTWGEKFVKVVYRQLVSPSQQCRATHFSLCKISWGKTTWQLYLIHCTPLIWPQDTSSAGWKSTWKAEDLRYYCKFEWNHRQH